MTDVIFKKEKILEIFNNIFNPENDQVFSIESALKAFEHVSIENEDSDTVTKKEP